MTPSDDCPSLDIAHIVGKHEVDHTTASEAAVLRESSDLTIRRGNDWRPVRSGNIDTSVNVVTAIIAKVALRGNPTGSTRNRIKYLRR